MRKNALSNAILAGVAGVAGLASVANAVNLNPDGLGEVLVYPYYTVNNNLNTLISVVNTTDVGKAVKVRFLEGRNSREVLDFNLYLSPFDVWTAAVFGLSDTGAGNLLTDDNSCTVPAIKGNTGLPALPDGRRYVPFVNFAYVGTNNDSGPDALSRTREGHFEMIEMGEVNNITKGSLTAITHNAAGVPANCAKVRNAWIAASADPYWIADANTDITPPAGGLFGTGSIVDVVNGKFYAYNADAVDAFSATNLHTNPGSTSPSLASANTSPGLAQAIVFSNGTLITADYPLAQAIDAVSAVFSHDALFNEFVTIDGGAADSEWVVTFPTKNRYVDPLSSGSGTAIPPFTRIFPLTGTTGTAPVDVNLTVFNREEGPTIEGCVDPSDPACLPFSPLPPEGEVNTPQLLWETNVITFNQADSITVGSSIFGSTLVANVDAAAIGVTEGWMRLGLYDAVGPLLITNHISRPDAAANSFFGLPAAGFWAVGFTNGEASPGVLANYSGLYRHKGSRVYLPTPPPTGP
ncbi:MAG: hypothetical protein AB7F83_13675 [Lysobacterales bacterium]